MTRGGGMFDVVFPPKGRQDLDGGLNTKYERSLIPDNESPDCANVVFSAGSVGTRGGVSKLNTTAVGSFVVDGLYTRHDNTGAETMIVFAGGTAWQLGTTTFTTIASAQSVFTAGQRVGAAEFENHLFAGNGGVTPYKWNGVAWTRHGVPQASASGFTGTVSLTGGTFPAASYYYKVAFVNSASVEGNVSTAIGPIAVGAAGSVDLTGIPTAPQSHGVNARNIYRASGAAGSFYRIKNIADNTTTTFSDLYHPEGVAAPSDKGEPPNYNAIVAHGGLGRLFMNDPSNLNYVWYTDALEPYTVGSTNFVPIGDASFDIVRGVDVYDNAVVVLADKGIYLIVTPSNTASEWRAVRVRSSYGSKSPYATFLYNNKLGFVAMQNSKIVGIGGLSGGTIDPDATKLEYANRGGDLQSDRVEPDMFAVQELYVKNVSAMVFKNRAYIALTYGDGATTNNRVYVFDFGRENLDRDQEAAWSVYTGIAASQFTVYDGKLYFGSATANGFVYRLETTTYSDDSSAIDSYFWTKEFAGLPGHENLYKDFRWVKLLVDMAGSYYMTVTIRVDSDASTGGVTRQISLNPGGSNWNTLVWGSGVWGAGRSQDEKKITLGQVSGKRIQLKFSNQNVAGQRFKVHGINIGYNVKGKR